jgi:putative flavoprotein involved in K+ transport
MSTEQKIERRYGAIVVGGGQAGLSASYWLARAGVDHVVFEKKSVMHKWREERWDTFCLVTPNWQCQLPGHPYDGPDPHGFMVKPEILTYLDAFARKTYAPVKEGVEVIAVEREKDLFLVTTSAGRFLADAVFLATSLYGDPYRPRCAERVPDSVAQVHSTEYRNAASLPPGAVIVVGAGQSGAQIAEDLHLDGRKVHLVTGNAPRCARFYRGRDVVDWLTDIGQYEITVADEGMGRKRQDTNHYLTGRDGGRDIDLRAFARHGMSLYGRLKDVRDGRMVFEQNLKASLNEATGSTTASTRWSIGTLRPRESRRLQAPSISQCGRRARNQRPSTSSPAASAPSFGRPASRPIGLTSSYRSSTALATP